MHDLPDNLPAIGTARLPTAYEAAVAAMSKASTIDECREWTNRAEALASYARQSRDESLYRMAIRIQARATRRCGELLEQVQRADGTRTDLQPRAGDGPRLTRTHVADDAGLSNRQRKTALRVAAVPADDFERQVESEKPPTVTALAEQGTRKRPLVDLEGIEPEDFAAATLLSSKLRSLAEYCDTHDPARIAAGFKQEEQPQLEKFIRSIGRWMKIFTDLW